MGKARDRQNKAKRAADMPGGGEAGDKANTPDRIEDPVKEMGKLAFGTEQGDLGKRLLLQTFNATRVVDKSKGQDGDIGATFSLLRGIAPRDDVERLLVSQMVGTHEAAMECLRRANLAEQSIAGRDLNLRHAAKMMQIYLRQVEALARHRGKGQQKITVEHVTVQAGGQAIVGDIHPRPGEKGPARVDAVEAPPALADHSQADALGRSLTDQLTKAAAPIASKGRRR